MKFKIPFKWPINKEDFNGILRQVIKFNLPGDYPDELIDTNIAIIKNSIIANKEKIKQVLKIKNKKT